MLTLRGRAVVGTALVLVLAVAGYAIYHSFRNVTPAPPPGCQAGTGEQAITLDTGQAAIAATIAGVAQDHDLPRRAVTVAYATALQESKLTNLHSGDRDSVGVFQQRPSQGWGPARRIEDPVYATTRFFEALVQVRDYEALPVYQAAQAVQHSADGSAYSQYASVANNMTKAFTGQLPHGVWCWYSTPVGRPRLAAADRALTQAFGPLRVGRRGDPRLAVRVRHPAVGWTVAAWLVSHAASYGIQTVSYRGYQWVTKAGSSGWTRIKASQRPKAPPAVVLFG